MAAEEWPGGVAGGWGIGMEVLIQLVARRVATKKPTEKVR